MADPTPAESDFAVLVPEYVAMVLLVDDQAIIGEAIRRMLAGKVDIDFHYCGDPDEALVYADRLKPTVILQDLVLPGTDGLTLVRQYRAHPTTRHVPIIVLSTREDPSVKRDAFKAGADDYLVKLPDALELIARIRHHSRAYLNQLQRDEAYRALRESQQKLMETNLELQRLSMMDGLTGLSNRRHFNAYLEAEWLRAAREQDPLSLLMVDIDDFKAYNDNYGHLAGDEVLKRVAEVMRAHAKRPADLAARFGGEEFAMILPLTPAEGAQQQAQSLCEAIAALQLPHRGATTGPFVSVSIGCATTVPRRAELSSSLIDSADFALYDAKHRGKNRVSVRDRAASGGA
ncbi:diguanylate cyclase [Caldimonas sp. KR1-144]|uniref:diguanylate cyclase n=1 Tax=Caldimonas sp. KR1-144 TaxID=3400911 RepID=UPI003C0843E6